MTPIPTGPKLKGLFWKKAKVSEDNVWAEVNKQNTETLDLDLLTQLFQVQGDGLWRWSPTQPPNRRPNSADFADLFCRFVLPISGVSVIWSIRSADLLGFLGF